MDEITLDRAEYDRIKRERDDLKSENEQLKSDKDAAEQAKSKAEKDVEEAEAAKVKVEGEKAELQKKVDAAEETARQVTLRDDRLNKLGAGFKAKLGEKTSERLGKDAASMSDEDWTARLDELAELVGVKADAAADGTSPDKGNGGQEFSREEQARFNGGGSGSGNGSGSQEPTSGHRRSVVSRLTSK